MSLAKRSDQIDLLVQTVGAAAAYKLVLTVAPKLLPAAPPPAPSVAITMTTVFVTKPPAPVLAHKVAGGACLAALAGETSLRVFGTERRDTAAMFAVALAIFLQKMVKNAKGVDATLPPSVGFAAMYCLNPAVRQKLPPVLSLMLPFAIGVIVRDALTAATASLRDEKK